VRRSMLIATCIILAMVLGACGNNSSGAPKATPTPATVTVPDVIGDTEPDALVALGAAGLTAGEKTSAYDAAVTKGTVMSTNPKAGVVVQSGTAVDYLVSRGPAPTPTPSPKPTAKPTSKPTAKPTAKPTPTPSPKPTATPSPKPTAKPTAKPTPMPTAKPTPMPTPTPAPVPLPGSSWTLKSFVDQDSTSFPVPDGVTITATFSGTDVSGSSGCNTYSGPYVAKTDGEITIGLLTVTGRVCSETAMTAETAYLAALDQVRSYSATTAKLKLVAGGSSARLVFTPGTP
jgi:heat shock protein HslJ